MKKPERLTRAQLARLIAYYGVRNTELENLHVHHISDDQMRVLMLDVEKHIADYLDLLIRRGILQIRNRSVTTEAINDGYLAADLTSESVLMADVGDWHHILKFGPSYDRKGWPADG